MKNEINKDIVRNHILYQKLLPILREVIKFSVYEIEEICKDRNNLTKFFNNKSYMILGIIKTLELLFAEDKLQAYSLEARNVSGLAIELIDLQLRMFLKSEVDRVLEILQDLTK